jgi:hypothetical protein
MFSKEGKENCGLQSLQADSTDNYMLCTTQLVFQEVVFEESEVGRDAKENLVEMNKDGDLKDRIGIQVY